MSSGGSGWPPADAGGFGQDDRYADDEYGAERGYEWSEASGRSGGQGDQYGRGGTDQYGPRSGRHSSAPYDESYGQDSYGQGGYGQEYEGWQARDGYDRPGYGQGSYGQAGYGSYSDPGYGSEHYGQDTGQDRYAGGAYGQDAYGRDGYSGDYYGQPQPGQEDFGRDGYGAGGPHTDSYGRDMYSQEGYGPGGYGAENGYGSPQTGPFGRPELGGPAGSLGGDDQWHEGADDADAWDREQADHDDWRDDAGNRLLPRRFSGDDGGRGRPSGRRS